VILVAGPSERGPCLVVPMSTRSVNLRAFGASVLLLMSTVVASGSLGGCRTADKASAAPSRPASAVLALPSEAQIACLDQAGLPTPGLNGRRDAILGGPLIATQGPSFAKVDALSDQRIVNGRVYGNLRWRTRSVDVHGR
jgi:hypothetical protein